MLIEYLNYKRMDESKIKIGDVWRKTQDVERTAALKAILYLESFRQDVRRADYRLLLHKAGHPMHAIDFALGV